MWRARRRGGCSGRDDPMMESPGWTRARLLRIRRGLMRPGRRRTALAAAQAAAALALAASAAAAQTATSVALPPFSYFGSALVTHDLSPSAREAGVISQAQIQQLYRSM